MKKMKLLGIGLALMMIVSGCSTKDDEVSPKDTVKQFLTAIQKQDETALKATSQWDMTSIQALQMQEEDYLDKIDKDLQKDAHDTLYGFQFTVGDEDIQDDSAKVDVTLKVKDIQNTVKKGMKAAEKRVEELSKKKDFSDQQAQQEILRVLYENLRDTKDEKELKVTVLLKKNSDDQWTVAKSNKELETALLANGQELIKLIQ